MAVLRAAAVLGQEAELGQSRYFAFACGKGCCEDAVWLRSSPAIALRKGKSNFLFDCGEDTQRQLLRQALVRPGKIDRVFITRASAETAFGLPGVSVDFRSCIMPLNSALKTSEFCIQPEDFLAPCSR